jgi:hypothetical protein
LRPLCRSTGAPFVMSVKADEAEKPPAMICQQAQASWVIEKGRQQ